MQKKFAIPPLVLAAVGVITTTSPDVVSANVAKYVQAVGITHIPAWLSNPTVDRAIFWVSLIGAGIWSAIVWGIPRRRKPLQIIFNPTNPGRRFWSLETWRNQEGRITNEGFEYRVEIKNNTDRTLYNVEAITDIVDGFRLQQAQLVFFRSGTTSRTLNPGASDLVKMFIVPTESRLPGMLAGSSVRAYGDIIVKASAKGTREVGRRFHLDPHRVPVIFD